MSAYFILFFLSGFAGLVYEVVWLRLAMASFGVTTPFVSLVLSLFMAGFALGSWLGGRLARRLGTAGRATMLRCYAAAELLVGLGALSVPIALRWGRETLAIAGTGVTWDSGTYYLASALWIALALLPACIAMGTTFPLAMAAIQKESVSDVDRSFSYLYVANVLGATAGTVLSAFVLIELGGFRRTLLVAVMLSAAVAVAAFALRARRHALAASDAEAPCRERDSRLVGRPSRAMLGGLFLTGLASMAMEVVWIRQFGPYLGTFVYAFATILALYLGATFLGSRIYRSEALRRASAGGADVAVLGWSIAGLLALFPLAATDPRIVLPEPLRVALGIGPFCALVGLLTPLMVDRWSSGNPERAGSAYAVNVLGSITGPLITAFWLLPRLGERGTIIALALLVFAAGWLVVLRPSLVGAMTAPGRAHAAWLAALALAALAVVVLSKDFEAMFPRRQVERDHTATVIATGSGSGKLLIINGDLATVVTPVTKWMAHLPLAFLDRSPDNALVVCFGMGTTFRSLLSWGIRVTAVELVPSVPRFFGYYHADGAELLRLPRARVVIDDGRRFLERVSERYGVITIDPPPPLEMAASSLLYSREFYELVKNHLEPGGIVQQWVLRGDLTSVASAGRAIRDSFPHVRVFPVVKVGAERDVVGFHILASLSPIPRRSSEALAARLPASATADLLEWGPFSAATEVFNSLLEWEMIPEGLEKLSPSAPALEDDRPINEYFFLRRWVFPMAVPGR